MFCPLSGGTVCHSAYPMRNQNFRKFRSDFFEEIAAVRVDGGDAGVIPSCHVPPGLPPFVQPRLAAPNNSWPDGVTATVSSILMNPRVVC